MIKYVANLEVIITSNGTFSNNIQGNFVIQKTYKYLNEKRLGGNGMENPDFLEERKSVRSNCLT